MKEIIYSDISLGFEAHPITKKVRLVRNDEAITQALKNLVMTNRYEKLFDANHYTNVDYSLFENFDEGSMIILKEKITNAIKNFEPRAEVLNVVVIPKFDDNEFQVQITYLPVVGLEPIIVNIFLERNR